jgi:hypothetical protein
MPNSSVLAWMFIVTASICLLILLAASEQFLPHMLVSALIAVSIAALGVKENRQLVASGASKSLVAASTARHMGIVWTWGALAMLVTYLFILKWREWQFFVAAFALLGVLCLFLAATLTRDAEKGVDDPTILKIGRALSWVQLVGMIATMAGLLIDGKMTRYMNPAKYGDWAANHISFFGALALAIISFNALMASKPQPEAR